MRWSPHGRGRSKAISRSKRRNKIATRKNRNEKGRRAVPSGSKPHSYGESFSESGLSCGSQNETKARIVDKAIAIIKIVETRFIIFSWGLTKITWLEARHSCIILKRFMSLISK